jgi:hypothetical protein
MFNDYSSGGGGGGWGASGGNSPIATAASIGAVGGKAVNLNGFTVTWLTNGNRYGAIS